MIGLVGYGSESEEDDEDNMQTTKRKSTLDSPLAKKQAKVVTVRVGKDEVNVADQNVDDEQKKPAGQPSRNSSLASMLPAPKRSSAAPPPQQPTSSTATSTSTDGAPASNTSFLPHSLKINSRKPAKATAQKISLFSLNTSTPSKPEKVTNGTSYQPMLARPKDEEDEIEAVNNEDESVPITLPPNPNIQADVLANLGTNRERRGRHAPIAIMDYNLEEQYRENERARASGELSQGLAPVRSIAPGRHHISQLLNIVNLQKDSFEEKFAEGRRNKRESGAKYGF